MSPKPVRTKEIERSRSAIYLKKAGIRSRGESHYDVISLLKEKMRKLGRG